MCQSDARYSTLPGGSAAVYFKDPPYYDAIPCSDLSDFFFVWLKRTLPHHHFVRFTREPNNPLTRKAAEIVQDETRLAPDGEPKDRTFVEEAMQCAFSEGRRILDDAGAGAIVFADKTTEGWGALISGMLKGGWTVTASWPIATEMPSRHNAT